METTIWQTYPQDEVIVVGIINTSNQNQINNFIEENSLTFPILFDPGSPGGVQGGDTYNDYYLPNDGSPYPRDFIVDQEGILQYANNEIDTEWMHFVLNEYISEPELACENGEIDLGWGNCNDITGGSITPDGCMPSGCFSIEETDELNFSYINLGEFPSNIGELSNLNYIHISDCGIYGSLPASLGNLQNLVSIQIYDNDHDLPDSLGLDSQLSGIIPSEIANLENLQFLRLDNNELNGEIPIEFGQSENLVNIILSGNQLSGEIPQSLMGLTNLLSLSLSANQLSGMIPVDIVDLINLETIDLSNNNFSGEIPIGMEEIPNLYYVNLAENNLFGNIDEQFCDMYFVDFSNNAFCSPYAQCFSSNEIGAQDTLNCSDLDVIDYNINAAQFRVYQNYPNPFNPFTLLRYNIIENGLVKITIHDLMGKFVKTLYNDIQRPGYYQVRWNARDHKNESVPAGLYFYTIESGNNVQTMKMILLK